MLGNIVVSNVDASYLSSNTMNYAGQDVKSAEPCSKGDIEENS